MEYSRKKVDLFLTLLIAYFFVLCMSFYYLKFSGQFENYIMLTVVMMVAIISYYTNITLSLICVLVGDFGYGSYKLYKGLVSGVAIDSRVYYWIVVISLTGILVSFLSKHILEMQDELNKLEKNSKSLIMIDTLTGIRNSAAFFNELPIYMSLSRRYDLPIAIMLVRFKYSRKLKNIVGSDFFKEIIVECSDILKSSLRFEDRKYILEDEITFAFILISKKDGCEIVKNRIRENVEKIGVDKNEMFNKLKLEIQIGYYMYNDSINDAMEFLGKAEAELEYDV